MLTFARWLRPLSLLLFSFFGAAVSSAANSSLNSVLRDHGLALHDQDLAVEKDSKRAGGKVTYTTVVASSPKAFVEIEITQPIEKSRAQNYARWKYTVVRELYGARDMPYPGEITHETDCPPEKKPISVFIPVLGERSEVLIANATARRTFGVWEDDLIHTKGALCAVYDERRKSLLQFKVFQPADRFDQKWVLDLLASLKRL